MIYSFRAWIAPDGGNVDTFHREFCSRPPPGLHCLHLRLWDLNTARRSRNIIRIIRRRRPFYLSIRIGPRYWPVLFIGKRPRALGIWVGPRYWPVIFGRRRT